MVSPRRRGPKTEAGLQRCRTARLTHGYRTVEAYALRRAFRELRRAQVAALAAVLAGAPDTEARLGTVIQRLLDLAEVMRPVVNPIPETPDAPQPLAAPLPHDELVPMPPPPARPPTAAEFEAQLEKAWDRFPWERLA